MASSTAKTTARPGPEAEAKTSAVAKAPAKTATSAPAAVATPPPRSPVARRLFQTEAKKSQPGGSRTAASPRAAKPTPSVQAPPASKEKKRKGDEAAPIKDKKPKGDSTRSPLVPQEPEVATKTPVASRAAVGAGDSGAVAGGDAGPSVAKSTVKAKESKIGKPFPGALGTDGTFKFEVWRGPVLDFGCFRFKWEEDLSREIEMTTPDLPLFVIK